MRKILALCLLVSTTLSASAQSQKTDIRPHANRLTGEALKAVFSGVTHDGAYNFSMKGVPRQFYTETTRANGRAIYTQNGVTAEGNWSIKNDVLCFVYDRQSMNGGCFRVYNVANCYYYYDDKIILRPDELDRDYWTARSVKSGEIPTCDAAIS